MGRKSLKIVRQKEIMEAFYKVAQREGLENASLAKVGKEIDINPSLVLHYFGSKDELIFGLIDFIMDQYEALYKLENIEDKTGSHLKKIVNNLFSKEWNELIDDGVFYSCFALIFRSEKIKTAYKDLHENLRSLLAKSIQEAKDNDEVQVDNPKEAADIIFILVEGAYYYLSLYEMDSEYQQKLKKYKQAAFDILKFK